MCAKLAGRGALAEVSCELTDRWQEAGLMEAYRADLLDRYQDGCAHTVRPSVLPDALYPDLWLTGVALEELARMPQDRPWLLWVNFPGPHEPLMCHPAGAATTVQFLNLSLAQRMRRNAAPRPRDPSWRASCNAGPMACLRAAGAAIGLRGSPASVGCPDRNVVEGDGRPP